VPNSSECNGVLKIEGNVYQVAESPDGSVQVVGLPDVVVKD
jgi:hypothetical protein